jgi:peptide/nickel transport system permease protein
VKAIKILERSLTAIPIMFGVAIIVFLFMRLTPGDPVDIMMGQGGAVSTGEMEQLRAEFHLDQPLYVQLWLFLKDAVRGDLAALLVSLTIALPVGILSAARQNSFLDRFSMAGSLVGISMPGFWLGIVMILIFAVRLHWLPVQGRVGFEAQLTRVTGFNVLDSLLTGNQVALISSLKHLALPALTLGAPVAAVVARVIRSSMLETLRSDYVTLARSKGLSEWSVVFKHALRNALIPTVTVVGLQVGVLLSGNMIVETVFGWPGLGRMVVEAIFDRDFPLVQGSVMMYAFTFVIANLVVDVLYTYLNPKISL